MEQYRISTRFVYISDKKPASSRFRWGKNYLTIRRALQAVEEFKKNEKFIIMRTDGGEAYKLGDFIVEHHYPTLA